jgi:general secretion pathway protein I
MSSRSIDLGRPDAGLSLIEALAALAVFALVGVGLVQLQAQSLRALSQAETRALAELAANNALTQTLAARAPIATGAQQQTLTLAGRSWRVQVEATPMADAASLRLTATVWAGTDQTPAAQVHAFARAQAP